jgi:phage baseplate assembly protein W
VASKAFKDINLSFKRHPVTNDLVVIKNEDAIKQSVKNIIFTILGEKPFLPLFGSKLNSALFELDTNFNETKISDEISSVLLNNEPRISNILVSVSNPSDSHELNVTIQYDITGISAPSQAVDVVLFPARV